MFPECTFHGQLVREKAFLGPLLSMPIDISGLPDFIQFNWVATSLRCKTGKKKTQGTHSCVVPQVWRSLE